MEMVAGFCHITSWHFSVTKPYGINGHVSSGTPAGNHTVHSISPPAELRPARILLWRPGSEFWCDATREALNWAFQDPIESDWKPMVIIYQWSYTNSIWGVHVNFPETTKTSESWVVADQ